MGYLTSFGLSFIITVLVTASCLPHLLLNHIVAGHASQRAYVSGKVPWRSIHQTLSRTTAGQQTEAMALPSNEEGCILRRVQSTIR